MSWLRIKTSSSSAKEAVVKTEAAGKTAAKESAAARQGEPSASSAAQAVAESEDDSKSEKGDGKTSAPTGEISKRMAMLSTEVRRALSSMKISKARKGKAGKSGSPPVLKVNCVAAVTVQPGSGGAYTNYFGGFACSSTTDFGTLTGLFDICRVTGIQVRYQPMAPGATPRIGGSTTLTGNHVPMAVVYDPEATGPPAWGTVVNQRDWTDHKTNKFCNTGVAWEHTWKMATKNIMTDASGPELNASLGEWCDTTSYQVSLVNGAVTVAIYPEAQNYQSSSGAVLGTCIVVWQTEWSYRL